MQHLGLAESQALNLCVGLAPAAHCTRSLWDDISGLAQPRYLAVSVCETAAWHKNEQFLIYNLGNLCLGLAPVAHRSKGRSVCDAISKLAQPGYLAGSVFETVAWQKKIEHMLIYNLGNLCVGLAPAAH